MTTFQQLDEIVLRNENPVILLEGTRDLPYRDRGKLIALGWHLARRYPKAKFRTGNASGSDEAFASGVGKVDSSRLEYILPYEGHRQDALVTGSRSVAIEKISAEAEDRAIQNTTKASPVYVSMMKRRNLVSKLRIKSRYIIRDTLKVIGDKETVLHPAVFGVFYVNRDDPMKGGTGHTIRVCQDHSVPVVFQDDWMKWAV